MKTLVHTKEHAGTAAYIEKAKALGQLDLLDPDLRDDGSRPIYDANGNVVALVLRQAKGNKLPFDHPCPQRDAMADLIVKAVNDFARQDSGR